MMLAEIAGGLALGAILGLLGGGGSLVAIPILIYGFHYPFRLAISSGLAIVLLGVLPALALHWRNQTIHWPSVLWMGASGMVGAKLSSQMAGWIPRQWLLGLLIVLMLLSAVKMLRPDRKALISGGQDAHPSPFALMASGLGIGVLTGLVGVGGGFLLVPALLYLGQLPVLMAIPTSLVIIALNALAGLTGYWEQLPFQQAGFQWLLGMAAVGSLLGYKLSQELKPSLLRQTFALALLAFVLLLLISPPSK